MSENVLNMTIFSYNELKRLVNLIPETDPTGYGYGILLENIERYAAILQNVDWVLTLPDPNTQKPEIVQFSPPVAEEEKFQEGAPSTDKIADEGIKEEDIATYESAEVKSMITRARAEKKISSVKSWIQENFSVDGFSAIPEKQYPEVVRKLKEMGVT